MEWYWNYYTEQGSGTPTLSKVSGAASLSGSTVSYGNNTFPIYQIYLFDRSQIP